MDASERHTVITPTDATPGEPLGRSLSIPAVGALFGGYALTRPIGRGGMGHVYEAFDAELNRTVAVKTMLPELAAVPATRDRFVQEARALAAVSNDHVVTVHDVGVCDGLPFLVMEYLTGETLDARLLRAPVPLVQILKLGREVANGLAAAHQAGVVHRDVKPDNIYLDARNDRAVLIDFGLAHTPSTPSQSSFRAGTPLYMSPEQVLGEPIDPRTDLFSLGVVLYRLCTGRMPFGGESVVQWRNRLLSDQPPAPVEALNPNVPPPLVDLIRRLLAKKPDDRPASAAAVEWELMQVFQSVLSISHSGVVSQTGRVPSPSERTVVDLDVVSPPPPRRKRHRAVAVAAVGCVVAAVLLLRTPQPVASVPSGPSVVTPVTVPLTVAVPSITKPTPISLFDGLTLTGWHGVEGKTDQWKAAGGVLIGTHKFRTKDGKDGDQFLLTDREFTDFELTFEFRWPVRGGHTTLMLRAKDEGPTAEVDPNKDKYRVTGLELNLGDDGEDLPPEKKKPANPLYASGGVYKLRGPKPPAPNKPIGEWNAVKVTSDRSRMTVEWNGVVTFDEDLDQYDRKSNEVRALARLRGAIALRTHSGKPIEYRNLVVKPIER